MKNLLLLLVLGCGLCHGAEQYFGTVLMTRDGAIVPNVAVPTPGEVSAAADVAESARLAAVSLVSTQDVLRVAVDALALRAAALNGQVIVYGTCVGFGSQAMVAPTNVTATIIGQTFPSNSVDTAFMNLYVHYSSAMAVMGVQVASSLTTAWGNTAVLETELTTFPVAGSPVECYRMLIGIPIEAKTAFMRATGDVMAAVVGQFSVFEGLTVNGVAGSTVTNSIGVFKFGLLVEPAEGL